nr:MAG TPA: hypothetical protein [Caudoviricetes sp.]
MRLFFAFYLLKYAKIQEKRLKMLGKCKAEKVVIFTSPLIRKLYP